MRPEKNINVYLPFIIILFDIANLRRKFSIFFCKYLLSSQFGLLLISCCLHVICQLTWKRFSQLLWLFVSSAVSSQPETISNSLECKYKFKFDTILFYGKLSGHTFLMSNFVAKFLYEGRVNEHSALAATSGDSGAKNFSTIILSSLGLFFKLFAKNHKWCWIQTL